MSKLDLSPAELSVICDKSFLMHKVSIGEKIIQLFQELKSGIKSDSPQVLTAFPPGLDLSGGKINRGENYNGLAWRALDYPSTIQKENIFLFRTLLLWGEGFFFHLILSGSYLEKYRNVIATNAEKLGSQGWKLSQQDSPWDWALDEESHCEMLNFSPGNWDQDFIKISQKHTLTDFSNIPKKGSTAWRDLSGILFASA